MIEWEIYNEQVEDLQLMLDDGVITSAEHLQIVELVWRLWTLWVKSTYDLPH